MNRRPSDTEAAPYYFTYINQVSGDDVLRALDSQRDETLALLRSISEEKSLYRYAPDKWSIREVMNHVNDTERVFVFRALWFARGFDTPLPSFDQNIASPAAHADQSGWAAHIDEFAAVRAGTRAFFRALPEEAWERTGTASGYPFSVRALAFITAGHTAHHTRILRERYLA